MNPHDAAHFDAELLDFYETTSDNVCGVGFGFKTVGNETQQTSSVVFYVREKKPKEEIPQSELLPATLTINGKEYKTDVVELPATSVGYFGTCYTYANQAESEIARLQGFPTPLLPMRGGQEIVMCPDPSTAYGGYAVGTLGFFGIDLLDNKIVGVTNTHVAVENTYFAGDVRRPPADELLEPLNIIEPRHFALTGQKYPNCALIRDNGVSYHPAALHVKRYVPQYSYEQTVANDTLSNRVDAALLIMNPGKFKDTDTYFVDETSFSIRRPSDLEALENNDPPVTPPYLPFATRVEMDAMFARILDGETVFVRSTGRTTGPKGYCEQRKIYITRRIVDLVGSPPIPQQGYPGFPSYKDIFETKPFPGSLPGTWAGAGGDSGSAIIADFTTEEPPFDVEELSQIGTLATAVVTNHGYANNDYVKITGATPETLNGTYLVTVVNANTFTYTTTTNSGGAAITATGEISARRLQITPKIIGLLFAGTSEAGVPIASLCCRIDNIVDQLGIRAWSPEDDFDRVVRLKVPAPKIVTRPRAEKGLDLAITVDETYAGGNVLPRTYWHAGATIQNYPPVLEPGNGTVKLSNTRIYEKNTIGQTVGEFFVINSVSDNVIIDTFMFELVDGDGDDDNSSFNVLTNRLRATVVFDADVKNNYSIRVRATSSSGQELPDQIFTIKIGNLADFQPTDLLVTPSTIVRGAAGRYVGLLSTVSPSAADVFEYSLVPGTGATHNNQFAITNNSLFMIVAANVVETKSIRVRTRNNYNLLYEKPLEINIT